MQTPAHSKLQPAALLTVISGDVLARYGGADFAPVADGAVLYVGSAVRTSADARAVITLFEGSTVELEPASEIAIDAATTRGGSTIVELAQSVGRSWHVVTHLTTPDSRYEVKTPAATASVRGTAFEVAVEDDVAGMTTTVTTSEGRVATADAAGTTQVLVTPGEATTVRANAVPEAPRPVSAAQRVVTVTAQSESSLVVDPLGRANGIRNGKVLAQTPGARVRRENGTVVVTLPNVPDGIFATTVGASAGAPVTVTTTVADEGEDPVTIANAAEAGAGATTSGVELRAGRDKPALRALSTDESKTLREGKIAPKRSSSQPGTSGTQGTETQAPAASPLKKNDASPQPAGTSRRTVPPSPAPTRR